MCGIAGYFVTQQNERVRTAISLLALEMEERGNQSWGMFYGDPTEKTIGKFRVADSVRKSFILPDDMPTAMAVHTRYATTGKIKKTNAHPFTWKGTKGKVIGMHNGIIANHLQVGRAYKREYRVDSEHIFAHIAEGRNLSDLEGYGTVVYSLNCDWFIGRFNGGELSIASTQYGLFYASTEKAVRLALRIAGIGIDKWLTTKDGTLYALTATGIIDQGPQLNIQPDMWAARWEDGITTDMDVEFELEGDDVVHFPSDGTYECDVCTIFIATGDELYYDDDALMCKTCYRVAAICKDTLRQVERRKK